MVMLPAMSKTTTGPGLQKSNNSNSLLVQDITINVFIDI